MITLSHIEKNFGLGPVLTDFSMTINPGEKVGLIGANGSGKSTIFKLISGIEKPDKGSVAPGRDFQVGYLPQILERQPGETVEERLWKGVGHLLRMEHRLRELESLMSNSKENSNKLDKYMREYAQLSTDFEGQGGYSYESRIKQIVQGLGLAAPLDCQVMDLSGGEMARLQLAVLFLKKPEILLLDEPTNHLDFSAINWLEEYINQYEGTVIIISHDRYFLDRTIKRIVEVKDGKAEEYPGNYSYYLIEKEIRYELARKEYANQQKEIQQKEEAIKRLRTWAKQADSPKLFRKARAMERQLDRMEKVDRPSLTELNFDLQFGGDRSGKEVVLFKGVNKSFSGKPLFHPLDLKVFYGQRIGLIGPNGSGKSTILKMIIQEIEPDYGKLTIGASVKIGYFDQHQEILDEHLTILHSFRKDMSPMSETTARNTLAHYGFTGDQVFKMVKDLSGGERSRFILLKMVHSQVNFLILDEPTNHLDLPSIEILEEALIDYSGTLVVVSHDRYFLNQVVDEIYALEDGKLVYYSGNYDYYQQKVDAKRIQEIAIQQANSIKKKQSKRYQEKEKDHIWKSSEKKLTDLEEQIAILEEKISKNNVLMSQPENINNYQYLKQLKDENEKTQKELAKLWNEWEKVCERMEECK